MGWLDKREMPLAKSSLIFLHGRNHKEEAIEKGEEGQGGAYVADVGDGKVGADGTAQPGAAADAQVVNAREDRHGDRRGGAVGGLDHFCLAGDVEGCDGNAPKNGKGNDGVERTAGRKQEKQGGHDEADGHRKETITMGVVEVGKEIASQQSGGAENGENHGNPVVRVMAHLQQEWFDVTVGGEVGGGDEKAQEK